MKNFTLLIFAFFSFSTTYSQIGINSDNSAPHSSAQLDVKSTTKAFYPPRMTTTQKNAIGSVQAGAVVYDITLGALSFYNGTTWSTSVSANGWLVSGNNILTNTTGNVGIGLNTSNPNYPNSKLHVVGNSYFDGSTGIKDLSVESGIFSSGSIITDSAILASDSVEIGNGKVIMGGSLSGLVVNKAVGNTHAIFGSKTAGVSIESNWPGISFNAYYNGGRKPLSNGFVGGLSLNPATGMLLLYNSAAAGTTGTNIIGLERMVIDNLGNVGIGINNPSLPLSFATTLGKKISLYHGATGDAGFGVFGNELRINSDYNGADITFGYDNYTNGFTEKMRLTAGGNLGIGTNNPLEKLHIIGGIRASSLAGTGTRPLYATLSGQITTTAPALTYFYSIPSVAFSQDFYDDSRVNSDVQTYFNDASTHAIYAPVNVPDGATITYIAIKYLDNSTNELSCSLLTNNLNGTAPTETVVGNTINALQGTISVNNLTVNINNLSKSYLLRITGPWDGASMRIFGAVIGYTF